MVAASFGFRRSSPPFFGVGGWICAIEQKIDLFHYMKIVPKMKNLLLN